MANRDLTIRVSGLLQAIINSGATPDQWEPLLQQALKIHAKTVKTLTQRKATNGKTK